MSTLNRKHLWIKADIRKGELVDADTGEVLSCFRGNDLAVHVAFFNGGTLLSVANLTQAVLTVKDPADLEGDALMYKAQASLDDDLTVAEWNARANEHALFEFTGAETNVDIDAQVFKDLYVGVNVDTDDTPGKDLCFGTADLRIVEDGRGDGDDAPEIPAEYYTKDQADARYARLYSGSSNIRFVDGMYLELFDYGDSTWKRVVLNNGELQVYEEA